MSRIRLAILYGGRSGEHEVSLASARSVVESIDRSKYDLVLIGIDPEGHWHRHSEADFMRLTSSPRARISAGADDVILTPAPSAGALVPGRGSGSLPEEARIDVAFPILHGTYGEDGTVQGLLELADLPYVGAGVLGSAVGMDKDVQKRLLREAGLPVVEFAVIHRHDWERDSARVRRDAEVLGYPLFVKPANLGSSVGVGKAAEAANLAGVITRALEYDDKILLEQAIDGREIECSVLGNEDPVASVPGEVCPRHEFYSYEAKYVDTEGAAFTVPAPLSAALTETIRRMSIQAFRALECEGMARVDFFLERGTDRVIVNELNTIPGFTPISQYPRLWAASGLPYDQLIDRLVQLALERHARRARRRTSYRQG